jgi:hypothetical protein
MILILAVVAVRMARQIDWSKKALQSGRNAVCSWLEARSDVLQNRKSN